MKLIGRSTRAMRWSVVRNYATLACAILIVAAFAGLVLKAALGGPSGTGFAILSPAEVYLAGARVKPTPLSKGTDLVEEDVPENAIFFFGTRKSHVITPRQLCAIESAALHHPRKTVFVSWSYPTITATTLTGLDYLVLKYKNIKFSYVHSRTWMKDTPVDSFPANLELLETSKISEAYHSAVLPCASLYKYGGVYLDLDMMVLRDLSKLRNFLGLEIMDSHLWSSFLTFEKGHPFMKECLETVKAGLFAAPHLSTGVDPTMMEKVMKEWCKIPSEEYLQPGICRGVTILSSQLTHYPYTEVDLTLPYTDNATVAEDFLGMAKDSYTISFWSSISASWPIHRYSNQPMALLAHANCPLTASMHEVL